MLRTLLPTGTITRHYLAAGSDYASALDNSEQYKTWRAWERAYAKKGYRTIPLAAFIAHANGASLEHLVNIKREREESAVYHAATLNTHLPAGRPTNPYSTR